MTRTDFSITVEIPAPQPLVWSVMADVERWPEWDGERFARQTALTRSAASRQSRADSSTPIAAAFWRVTELNPGAAFTWVSSAPGVRVTAQHLTEAIAIGTRATLSIRYEGLLGALAGAMGRRFE
jgi:uncharacterized protein YndB with AHSA1/START domain